MKLPVALFHLAVILDWRPRQTGPAKQSRVYLGENKTVSKAGGERPGDDLTFLRYCVIRGAGRKETMGWCVLQADHFWTSIFLNLIALKYWIVVCPSQIYQKKIKNISGLSKGGSSTQRHNSPADLYILNNVPESIVFYYVQCKE